MPFSCSDQFDQATARVNQQVAVDVEIGATSSTDSILIDPFDTLCAPRCSAHDGVQWVYEDYGHVSSANAEEHLTPMFAAALQQTFVPSSHSDG